MKKNRKNLNYQTLFIYLFIDKCASKLDVTQKYFNIACNLISYRNPNFGLIPKREIFQGKSCLMMNKF